MSNNVNVWQSIHTHYIDFALLSLKNAKPRDAGIADPIHFDRGTVEAIRYSYDAIEASIEFTYSMGKTAQLREPIGESWLSRYLDRRWKSAPNSEKLPLMAQAWRNEPFWKNDDQQQLFEDLRTLRGGLTHPRPYGVTVKGNTEKLLRPNWLVNKHPKAGFAETPEGLGQEDASVAVEIMLRHLIRIEDLFFGGRDSFFSVFDRDLKDIVATTDLLDRTGRAFDCMW